MRRNATGGAGAILADRLLKDAGIMALVLVVSLLLYLNQNNLLLAFEKPAETLPFVSMKDIDPGRKVAEPSGIAFHPERKTLFVADDEGLLAEMDTDGKILARKNFVIDGKRADFEGVTVNPRNGVLFLALEKGEILEITSDKMEIKARYRVSVKNSAGADFFPLPRKRSDGIEAIAYLPGNTPALDYLIFSKQYDPAILCLSEVPVQENGAQQIIPALSFYEMPFDDLSGLAYNCNRKNLFLISDKNNLICEINGRFEILKSWQLPGEDQEGIDFDQNNNLYIAQDSGGILKVKLKDTW